MPAVEKIIAAQTLVSEDVPAVLSAWLAATAAIANIVLVAELVVYARRGKRINKYLKNQMHNLRKPKRLGLGISARPLPKRVTGAAVQQGPEVIAGNMGVDAEQCGKIIA